MEVPGSLKRLVRAVMRGFYTIEHVLFMDMLIRKSCVKDDDFEQLLHFDNKQIRTITTQLKNDKMLKLKLRMETGPNGKTSRQNYYYINYRALVNVVKYKLDHMRRKIETEERDNTSRASFVCTECRKTYTDLEADQLCDLMTGEFKCTYCHAIVEEDPNVLPKADSRQILARFNEQIEPFYILLKEVEDIVLPSDLLDSELADYIPIQTDKNSTNQSGKYIKEEDEEGRKRSRSSLMFDANLTVKIENVNDVDSNGFAFPDADVDRGPENSKSKKAKKEQPSWLSSTAYNTSTANNSVSSTSSTIISKKEKESNHMNGSELSAVEAKVAELLMNHESRSEISMDAVSAIMNSPTKNSEDRLANNSMRSNSDVLMESDDEGESPVEGIHVKVGGNQLVPLTCVEDNYVNVMSRQEREQFVKLTQEIYSYLYDC